MSRFVCHFAYRSRSLRAVASIACVAGLLTVASAAYAQGLYQSPAPTLPTSSAPQQVAAADFARSGFQSLVVTNSASNTMTVYLATGPATFAAGVAYPTCPGPVPVLAMDVSQDGYPDIIVACPNQNTVQVWLNNGASNPGSFRKYVSLNASSPVALAAGDFLGSGTIDLAAATRHGGITIFLNEGGTIVTKIAFVSGTETGIVTGDFNHDGHLDLAVSDSSNNKVHILTGDGAGNFTQSGAYFIGSGTKPSGIVAGDFNHDGNLDVATINAGNNTATILLGSPTGALTVQPAQATGINPIAIATADVNSDGNLDVIAFDSPTSSTGQMDVLLGNGDGTLQTAQSSSLSFAPGTFAAVADFNRDGKPDLAITQQNTDQVSLLLNNTLPTQYLDGRSYSSASKIAQGNGNMADSIAVGDFNKDGLADIAVSYLEDNVVRVMTNNGSGGFNTAATYAVGNQPYDVVSADLNGDGYPDLVTANTNPNSATGSVSVLLNNGKGGNGTFAAAVNYTVGRDPYQVAVGDLNGDGFPDLAVTNYASNTVSILFGSKTGTFTPASTLSTCANPYGVAIGNFGHDEFPSIAVTCYGAAQLEVFVNNGNGTFRTPVILTTNANPASLVVGDFNRDGNLDIVVGNSIANNLSFFAGHGDDSFSAGVTSPSLNFPNSIAAGDVNGDGILDIVAVAAYYDRVAVALGAGDGTFGTFYQRQAGEFLAPTQPWAVALGDFDNDGQLDIVTANTYNRMNIALPAYQQRYMAQYPPVPGGHPSVDLLNNGSAVTIGFSANPPSPLPFNNSGTTITATVQPPKSGSTPTGSVIFEDSTGAPLGSGPYPLTGGSVSVATGHLASGQYLFTTLYSGDIHHQPTTASGSAFTVTVSGNPTSLSLSPTSVPYTTTFTVSVVVTGTAMSGAPQGTVTVYAVSGSTTLTLGTITLTPSGNNGVGSATYTAAAPLNAGTYQVYGNFTPSSGPYQPGSSPSVLLTITGQPTSISLSCPLAFEFWTCTATVTVTATSTPVPAGTFVNFTGPAGNSNATVGANGQATYSFTNPTLPFTVTAEFPQQSNYLASPTASFTDSGASSAASINSLTGLSFRERSLNRSVVRQRAQPVPLPFF